MNEALYLAIVFLLIFSLYGIDARRRELRRRYIIKERMPAELSDGRLIHSEQYIRTEVPRKMHGTLDQLYQIASGVHVLVESKTRDNYLVYQKDVVQISTYSTILSRIGYQMAEYAYLRVVTPEGVEYIKQSVLNESEIISKYDRTRSLMSGEASPGKVQHKGMCRNCPQLLNCDEWQFSGDN